MKARNKVIALGIVIVLCTSACGIFKKDCGCPKFGKVSTPAKATNRA